MFNIALKLIDGLNALDSLIAGSGSRFICDLNSIVGGNACDLLTVNKGITVTGELNTIDGFNAADVVLVALGVTSKAAPPLSTKEPIPFVSSGLPDFIL